MAPSRGLFCGQCIVGLPGLSTWGCLHFQGQLDLCHASSSDPLAAWCPWLPVLETCQNDSDAGLPLATNRAGSMALRLLWGRDRIQEQPAGMFAQSLSCAARLVFGPLLRLNLGNWSLT
jgi:hypothetical protein